MCMHNINIYLLGKYDIQGVPEGTRAVEVACCLGVELP